MAEDTRDLTVLLKRWRQGDGEAAAELLREAYGDLHRVASGYMRGEREEHTLQATALLNEAWIRLARSRTPPVEDRQQFFRAMAAYMRRHLVDHARRRRADKRGGGQPHVDLDDVHAGEDPAGDDAELQLQQLDQALETLRRAHPRAARVVELRFFAGKPVEEVAELLSVSTGTVKRDFAFAKAFLLDELKRSLDERR